MTITTTSFRNDQRSESKTTILDAVPAAAATSRPRDAVHRRLAWTRRDDRCIDLADSRISRGRAGPRAGFRIQRRGPVGALDHGSVTVAREYKRGRIQLRFAGNA